MAHFCNAVLKKVIKHNTFSYCLPNHQIFCIFHNVLKVSRYKKEVKMKLEIGQFVHKVGGSVLVSKDKQIPVSI